MDAWDKNRNSCTLILTEGNSAKSLALNGLSVLDEDRRRCYGVFALNGSIPNVGKMKLEQLLKNKVINNLMQVLGLTSHSKNFSLRYGRIIVMTDPDEDGTHIKGMMLYLIFLMWTPLLKCSSKFLATVNTPIIKATSSSGSVHTFETLKSFEQWRRKKVDLTGWKIKYYKGLGTNTNREGRTYFLELHKMQVFFKWENDEDDRALELAFEETTAARIGRKKLIEKFQEREENELEQENDRSRRKAHKYEAIQLRCTKFIHDEYVLYGMASLKRQIPALMDGLTPCSRKIMFGSFERNLKYELKVSRLVGYVADVTCYHHDDEGMAEVAVGLAQDFVGSWNNINLMKPAGQFGTRNMGGKDKASHRYISTELSPVTRFIFVKDDDQVLNYLNEDGKSIEPEWFVPIIPMVLVNGSTGCGFGWKSEIPCYDPKDIIANIRLFLNKEEMKDMTPWYKGWKGQISKTTDGNGFIVEGSVEWDAKYPQTATITELPIRSWTEDYVKFLKSITDSKEITADSEEGAQTVPSKKLLSRYQVYYSGEEIRIEVNFNQIPKSKERIIQQLKLQRKVSTKNMVLFDSKNRIQAYANTTDIIKEFAKTRKEYYRKRKVAVLESLGLELNHLVAVNRFVQMMTSDRVKFVDCISDRTKLDEWMKNTCSVDKPSPSYEHFMTATIRNLVTSQDDRNREIKELELKIKEMERKGRRKLWREDLEAFERECERLEDEEKRERLKEEEEIRKKKAEYLKYKKWEDKNNKNNS